MSVSAGDGELVMLSGGSEAVGEAYGRAARGAIQTYLADFEAAVAREELDRDDLRQRVDRYRAIVARLAPWWQDEAAGIARGAGVDPDAYTAYVAQKYVLRVTRSAVPHPPHECTSYLAVGSAVADGGALLHKNRDSFPRAQAAWIWAAEGRYRYLGGGDAGDHGVIHVVNERGLAGIMNAGSPNADHTLEGLPTPQILKLVAERAATCAEALEIIREIVGLGWYTNGATGSIWLFADSHRALVVENTLHDLDYRWIDGDVLARANDFLLPGTRRWARPESEREPRLLTAQHGAEAVQDRATARDLQRLSRDTATTPRPICAETTLSGFTAVVGPDRPPMAWIALGRPTLAPYLPLYVEAAALPRPLVDGTFWTESMRASPPPDGAVADQRFGPFEEEVEVERRDLERRLAGLPADGPAGARGAVLAEATAGWTARALDLLAAPADLAG